MKSVVGQAEANVRNEEFSKDETQNQMLAMEEDIVAGLLEAAAGSGDEEKEIEVARNGKVLFRFTVRPLEDGEYEKCKNRCTKYVRNKQLGMKMPEQTDNVKYRSMIIYTATVERDREKLWDNKKVWQALSAAGKPVVTGTDVIDAVLFAGEKSRVIDIIDQISGYDSNLEEVVKN